MKKAEGAFLAGVLHEVGWLLNLANTPGRAPAAQAERALLGAYLLGLWGLPHSIIEAVAYHKEPQLVPHSTFELVDVIYIADYLATELRSVGPDEGGLDLAYLAGVGMDEAKLAGMQALAEKIVGTTIGD